MVPSKELVKAVLGSDTIKGEFKEAQCIFMAGEEILRRLNEGVN